VVLVIRITRYYTITCTSIPVDGNGQAITHALGSTPYIEGSVGVENIFKFVRVDLVKRFTYLDYLSVPKWGVRVLVQFDF
jgi:hypothetical protein